MVLLQGIERLLERAGHVRDLRELFGRQGVDVLVERITRIDLVLDTVEAGHHHGREGEVRVARRVGERTSMRRAFGELMPATGIRIEAERLRLEYARLTGASNPGPDGGSCSSWGW